MHSAIQVQNLSFAHKNKEILRDISVNIPIGGINILLGINGSGKSTFMRIIANLQSKYQGKVYILGREQQQLRSRERAENIGFLGQFFNIIFPFTVRDILLTGTAAFRQIAPKARDYTRMEEVLEIMQIRHLQNSLFPKLSGGEQQMVLIARVLMQNPKILLLDEPTNHLDIYYQQRVLTQLKLLSQHGYTILCTLHNPTQAFQFADRLLFMHQGKLLSPQPQELSDDKFLEKIYQVPFQKIAIAQKKYTFVPY